MDVSRGRLRRVLATSVAIMSIASLAVAERAAAFGSDYPEFFRSNWQPTFGSISLGDSAVGNCKVNVYCHHVDEVFKWGDWIALSDVDSPRTPAGRGTYEHELRFRHRLGPNEDWYWCNRTVIGSLPMAPYANLVLDLPQNSYEDTIGIDAGEFSWGVQAWRLTLDTEYGIAFDCSPRRDINLNPLTPLSPDLNVTGQIGHCHAGGSDQCDGANVYADETTRLIPDYEIDAPGFQPFFESFMNNNSLECCPTPGVGDTPFIFAGTAASRECSGAYHRSCYWRLSGILLPGAYYDAEPFSWYCDSPCGGTASLINEWVVRCSTENESNCSLQVLVHGYNASGGLTETQASSWMSLAPSTIWSQIGIHTEKFPSGTAKWRFEIRSQSNMPFHLDYNKQYYHVPS